MGGETQMSYYFMVALGGALGAVLRAAITTIMASPYGIATLIINTIGCTLMGAITYSLQTRCLALDPKLISFIMTGVLGGFTTFSTFSAEVMYLWQKGELIFATLYASASLVLSLSGFCFGQWILK